MGTRTGSERDRQLRRRGRPPNKKNETRLKKNKFVYRGSAAVVVRDGIFVFVFLTERRGRLLARRVSYGRLKKKIFKF